MANRRKTASVAFTGATTLAAVALIPGHAHAAGVTKVVVTPGGPYTAANVGTATAPTTGGTTKGETKSISATITGVSGFGCKATATGSVPFSYNNSTGQLTVDASHAATLTIMSATSCAGAINAGDKVYNATVYAVNPKQTVSAT